MKKLFSLLVVGFLITGATLAQSNQRSAAFNLDKSHLAIQGYDPVAYFSQNKAIVGKASNALSYDGVTYYFVSAENKETFRATPGKFEPQYGGWCAYAMGAKGEKVSVDPETFKIVNGRLYLFYNSYFNNTLKSWNKNEKTLNAKADENWKKFFK